MTGTAILPGTASGAVLACGEGLSFWGGVDPLTGVVIDARHPLHGRSVAGRVMVMPTTRGSCSGSGVVLDLALNGLAPAALVFREAEDVATLGAMIAARMFGRPVPVVRLGAEAFAQVAGARHADLAPESLIADGAAWPLASLATGGVALTARDRALMDGGEGAALATAMGVIVAMAALQGAAALTDVTRGHIDGCILAHDANLAFAERMAAMGARVAIPTTINAISVDREGWRDQGVAPGFGLRASRLADAYVAMGARPTFTCAPYLLDDAPRAGGGDRLVGIQRGDLRQLRAGRAHGQASRLPRPLRRDDRARAPVGRLPRRGPRAARGAVGGAAARRRRRALADAGLSRGPDGAGPDPDPHGAGGGARHARRPQGAVRCVRHHLGGTHAPRRGPHARGGEPPAGPPRG